MAPLPSPLQLYLPNRAEVIAITAAVCLAGCGRRVEQIRVKIYQMRTAARRAAGAVAPSAHATVIPADHVASTKDASAGKRKRSVRAEAAVALHPFASASAATLAQWLQDRRAALAFAPLAGTVAEAFASLSVVRGGALV